MDTSKYFSEFTGKFDQDWTYTLKKKTTIGRYTNQRVYNVLIYQILFHYLQ